MINGSENMNTVETRTIHVLSILETYILDVVLLVLPLRGYMRFFHHGFQFLPPTPLHARAGSEEASRR